MAELSQRGAGAPAFGLTRQPTTRIEIVFALKSGGFLTVYQNMDQPVTEELLDSFATQLSEELSGTNASGNFSDDWGATGQRAWVNLGDVAGFSVRPIR